MIDHKTTPTSKESISFKDTQRESKQTTVDLPIEIWVCAKQNLILFKDAMMFGIRFLLAEKDEGLTYEYPDCMLLRKKEILARNFAEKCEECNRLKDQLEGKDPDSDDQKTKEDIKAEADEILSQNIE